MPRKICLGVAKLPAWVSVNACEPLSLNIAQRMRACFGVILGSEELTCRAFPHEIHLQAPLTAFVEEIMGVRNLPMKTIE